MSSRPQGDGKDFAYRQTIDKRYAVAARQRARLLATCRMHLLCGVLAFAWAVFVPRSLGVHTVPLPCTAAVTAVFCGVFGASAATGNPAALAGFAKIARSCIFLGLLTFLLPRYSAVPGNAAAPALARYVVKRYGTAAQPTLRAALLADHVLEASLMVFPLLETILVYPLIGGAPLSRKKEA